MSRNAIVVSHTAARSRKPMKPLIFNRCYDWACLAS